ncbi:MAG: imelysin family protein [Crocinitomicaceae bacterium]|nr:imelysin family protein [Flavobacteriales bacterium]NQZ36273.1 imelysin family protein [Crocinitomicaceae bacterium]
MIKFHQLSILLIVAILSMASSCNKPDDDVTPFDKESLLINFSDNLIAPSLSMLQTTMDQMESDFTGFQADPTQVNLDVLRNSWKDAYLTWQTVKPFDFGPIKSYGFKAATGTYPSDTIKIEANVAAGSYTLASAGNIDAVGLHSLDFLLHRANALSFFLGDANYMTYTGDVIAKLRSETTTVANAWTSYATTFKASTGTETTSSFSELVNEFNRDYELAKVAKLGIPIGKQSLGIQMPYYLEARNSGISLDLLRQNVLALQRCYHGNAFAMGNSGVGFDDYLIHLERTTLNETINANFSAILAKIDSFSGSMENEMSSNSQGLDELYMLMQGQVISLKTDMTSAFGVLITYQDNDGD